MNHPRKSGNKTGKTLSLSSINRLCCVYRLLQYRWTSYIHKRNQQASIVCEYWWSSFLGDNGAGYAMLLVNVGMTRKVIIAVTCCQQAVKSAAPAQGHADVRMLLGNVYFWYSSRIALVCWCRVIDCVNITVKRHSSLGCITFRCYKIWMEDKRVFCQSISRSSDGYAHTHINM